MHRDPRGSWWRKWDLHLHGPTTALSNGYLPSAGQPDWDQYCEILETSDVAAFGITDYFRLSTFYDFKREHSVRYRDSSKLFFPNLELRLSEIVNKGGQHINLHLVFRPDLDEALARRFENLLATEWTSAEGRTKYCSDLTTQQEFESATVSRTSIIEAIKKTFGERLPISENVLIVPSVKGDGIRPGGSGRQRKAALVDEIDKMSHGFFGNSSSRAHFLRTDRLEEPEATIAPKPVFSGCDAHNFRELRDGLGQAHSSDGSSSEITWIKADLTFEGLQQTLIEPEERVAIQPLQPDFKESYKYISTVRFTNAASFPSEVTFNPNLTSIIGSRSSGKSALLAYIAHTVDPEHTIDQQVAATGKRRQDVGPAAGYRWSEVEGNQCTVEWGNTDASGGKVVYIPQNSLFAISEQPELVTEKIEPVLLRRYPDLAATLVGVRRDVTDVNADIRKNVEAWFDMKATLKSLSDEASEVGDQPAILSTLQLLDRQIAETKDKSALDEEELEKYQHLLHELEHAENRLAELNADALQLNELVQQTQEGFQTNRSRLSVSITIRPDSSQLPAALSARILGLVESAEEALLEEIVANVADYRLGVQTEHQDLSASHAQSQRDNAGLIEKNRAEVVLEDLVQRRQAQQRLIERLDVLAARASQVAEESGQVMAEIVRLLELRRGRIEQLKSVFGQAERELDGLVFHVESGYPEEHLVSLSGGYRKNELSPYIDRDSGQLLAQVVQADPAAYLERMQSGRQGVNRGADARELSVQALSATPHIRFSASLDGDRIGGFSRSSMTPGKQALFALTLIMNETEEGWPLLIDQPEDDLDSRSIYDVIVPYLMARKKERQIIMVSHNANLVIGADSEEVLVSNRHGDDSPNRDERTFAYLSGALEHSSETNPQARYTLGACGIRQHACEILDGGVDAFRKRQSKYNIAQA